MRYLELRTTPRQLMRDDSFVSPSLSSSSSAPDELLSKEEYVLIILDEIRHWEQREIDRSRSSSSSQFMVVRLLLSIDRSASVSAAMETVELATKLRSSSADSSRSSVSKYIVGIDVSGNPTKNSLISLLPALKRARSHGLKITVHVGEVDSLESESEMTEVIKFKPERLGHALCINDEHKGLLHFGEYDKTNESDERRRIPIELCPTSNMTTLNLHSLKEHPTMPLVMRQLQDVQFLRCISDETDRFENVYPISINTDDSGVFRTSASRELMLVASSFNLTREQTVLLAWIMPMYTMAFIDKQTSTELEELFRLFGSTVQATCHFVEQQILQKNGK